MDAIGTLAVKLSAFNVNETLRKILDTQGYGALIPQMVKSRLGSEGTYSTGEPIFTKKGNPYSSFTVAVKSQQTGVSGITSHVTLHDSGKFWSTFALKPTKTSFSVEYNDNKPDGKVSDNIPALESAISLTDQELDELRYIKILPDFIEEFRNAIL